MTGVGVRPPANRRVLSIGIDPRDLDPDQLGPGMTVELVEQRAAEGRAAVAAAGYDVRSCLVGTDPDAAEAEIRAQLADTVFGLVMIGGGIRALPGNTLLFERLVNVLAEQEPRIRFCFNTAPDTTREAIARWLEPGGD